MSGIIIGLVGRQGSGKDEVAEAIQKEFDFKHVKFATALKEISAEFGLVENTREDKERDQKVYIGYLDSYPKLEEAFGNKFDAAWTLLLHTLTPYSVGYPDRYGALVKISPRKFQQILGTEVGRTLYPDIWIDAALQRAEGNVVISDVRFLDEAKVCDHLIFVDRPATVGDLTHTSERFTEEVYNFFKAPWDSHTSSELDFIRRGYYEGDLRYITNAGSLKALGAEATRAVDLFLEKYDA